MDLSLDSGALLARSHQIPRGPRVRLRMVRPADEAGIRELLRRYGHSPEQLQVAGLIRFDPRRRVVLCATALIDSTESVVAIGSIELDRDGDPAPELLVVDQALADGTGDLLERALLGRAAARRAA